MMRILPPRYADGLADRPADDYAESGVEETTTIFPFSSYAYAMKFSIWQC